MAPSRPELDRRRARRAARLAAGGLVLGTAGLALGPGCSAEPTTVLIPSLGSAGAIAFVCLDDPALGAAAARPMSACSEARTIDRFDYSVPHIYALVLQPTRGEIAVVDLTTADNDAVVDQDPLVPGANFLPIGAQPTDLVATPGGTTAFAAAAEIGRPGIYALPTTAIRGSAPRLSSWPACAVPAAPGTMVLVRDPADANGELRPSCDAAYGADEPGCGDGEHCHGDLAADAAAVGDAARYKLLVALPGAGGVAVIDAQAVLDTEPGAYPPCHVERWLPLDPNPPVLPVPPPPVPTAGCVNPPPAGLGVQSYVSEPAGLALQGGHLYVADTAAPVIHRVAIADPCDPVEEPPLLPTSVEDPTRVVTTRRIAVGPLDLDLDRYLYAIDEIDGSIMVFDVSDGAAARTPLVRSHPERNPFQPADRIRFQAPPRDIVMVEHQVDLPDTQTGATAPVRCDPDPASTGPGTAYRTSAGYDSGAGPAKLRGVFAMAVLSSGEVVVLDVDDYDGACRGPVDRHALFGCSDETTDLATSGEYSCATVVPHQTRASGYLVNAEGVAANTPGVASLPILFDSDGSALTPDDDAGAEVPRMRATAPVDAPPGFELSIAGKLTSLDPSTGALKDGEVKSHTLVFNLEDPRAHILDQGWSVTFEGALPGFDKRFAAFNPTDPGAFELRDAASRFCDRGVHSQEAVRLALAGDPTVADPVAAARDLADYVQISSSTPVDSDVYWQSAACTYDACRSAYGSYEQPRPARDFRILEAYQDRLELEPRATLPASAPDIECCFPYAVEFRVRAGRQWLAVGDSVGLLHHVIQDDEGRCRDSCDPNRARENARAREVPQDDVALDGDPRALVNPAFRLAIHGGKSGAPSARDLRFRFSTQGAFHPMVLSFPVAKDEAQPQFTTYLPQTGELVMADGAFAGIAFLSLSALAGTRQYN
ncbi:MAG: hypothetical protein HY908_35830 [Myxococcales bacterium]|nr:hypothetical protein [Myxococcales bacterium]